MVKTKKVVKSKVAQTLSKEMKQTLEGMIQKALKPYHKHLSDLEQKLQTLKMDKAAPKKAKAKKATKVLPKSKAPTKAKKSKKTKTLKDLKA